ncbi:MAG: GGDEF domain-containing protein [archaeon]
MISKINFKLLVKIIFTIMFILLGILTYTLIFTQINDYCNFIFGYAYNILGIFIFYSAIKIKPDKKTMIGWVIQMIIFTMFLLIENYLLVKAMVLIGILLGVRENFSMVAFYQKQNKIIEYLSFHDELTGLYNRRYFEKLLLKLEGNINMLNPISIIICDINDLKKINDYFGHIKGDEYIKKTSTIIKSTLKKSDVIARIGGDEFAIVLSGANNNDCKKIVEKIKTKAKKNNINIAIGYATNFKCNLENLVNQADKEMYKNKEKIKKNKKDSG